MNEMKKLTPSQQATLEFIKDYQFKYHTRPTDLQVGQHLNRTVAAAHFKVDALLRKRIIKLENNLYVISNI